MITSHNNMWQQIKDCTMTTINKRTGKMPSSEWKIDLLISEHSPIRRLIINWKWSAIKYWVSVHFTRHKYGIEHWVGTQRSDRTGISRDELTQDTEVPHEFTANAQAMINVSRKRLCFTASPETTKAWEEVLLEVKDREPELYLVCVPECVYRGGCSQFGECKFYNGFKVAATANKVDLSNIKERYEFYKEIR